MLLKIITNQNKTKIITDIQDAEVWDNIVPENPIHTMDDAFQYALGMGKDDENLPAKFPDGSAVYLGITTYDSIEEIQWESEEALTGGKLAYDIRVVDYQKDNQWHRVVLTDHAYLCNDEGRTIQKIG